MEDGRLDDLFADAKLQKYPSGQILIYEGDAPENIYYLMSGYVKVYSILGSGAERTIFVYGPGDAFPLTSYLSQAGAVRYFYEAVTGVDVKRLAAKRLEKKVKDDFSLGESLIQYTYTVNEQFFQRIDALAAKEAKRKIVSLLLFLVAKAGSSGPESKINIPLTSQDIANMCGLTRETASAQLQSLRKSELLSGIKHITINVPKLDKLRGQLDLPSVR